MLGSRGRPRDSAVVSHERHLFKAGVAVKRSLFRRAGAAGERRNGVEAEKPIASARVFVVVAVVYFQSAICICSFVFWTRKERSVLSPPPTPPSAHSCQVPEIFNRVCTIFGFVLSLRRSLCNGVSAHAVVLLTMRRQRRRVCSHIVWTLSAKAKAGISAPSVLRVT